MSLNCQVLLLRTFTERVEDLFDIALIVAALDGIGCMVVVGEHSENQSLRRSLEADWHFDTATIDRVILFKHSTHSTWQATVIEEILQADAIIVRFTPKTAEFPDITMPGTSPFNILEYYQIAPLDPSTGRGLLQELSYCDRLGALPRTILLFNEWQAGELTKLIKLTSIAVGGEVFTASGRWLTPKFSALDKQVARLGSVKCAIPLPPRSGASLEDAISIEIKAILRNALGIFALADACKSSLSQRRVEGYLDVGVSDEPARVFPDYELKRIRFTPVEKLLFIPYGSIVELHLDEVVARYGLVRESSKCPYCNSIAGNLLFYAEGLEIDQASAVRCKCQDCGRRSTLIDDILVDM